MQRNNLSRFRWHMRRGEWIDHMTVLDPVTDLAEIGPLRCNIHMRWGIEIWILPPSHVVDLGTLHLLDDAPRTLLLAGGLVGRPMFCGVAFNPGIRPGLICSGIKVGCAWVAGSDCVCPRSVVIAGMHPGRADGPLKTSEKLLATAALKRPNRVD